MILSDVTALSGKKFANTDIELINIPFKTNISPGKPCEVDITYTSFVANTYVIEELKICYHQGKRVYEKLTDLSLTCPAIIQTPKEVHEKGYFIDNLREYREKAKGEIND